jgi:hypothetical protein
MAGMTISIQLSDAEIKALSAMQISENESLNKTATRLLKGILGQSKTTPKLSTAEDIKEIVRQEVKAVTSSTLSNDEDIKQVIRQELTDAITQIKGLVDDRLQGINSPKEEVVSVELQSRPDYEAIRSSVLAKLKVGKQSAAAKGIEAFIKELNAVTLPEQPATLELDTAS